MTSPCDIIISVLPRHIETFLRGEKTVELRKRPVRVPPRSRVWIYGKIPRGTVEVLGVVDSVHYYPPNKIWKVFGDRTGLERGEFESYFKGVNIGCAIAFKKVLRLDPPLHLNHIRATIGSFLPPQFFRSLSPTSPELELFLSASRLAPAPLPKKVV